MVNGIAYSVRALDINIEDLAAESFDNDLHNLKY